MQRSSRAARRGRLPASMLAIADAGRARMRMPLATVERSRWIASASFFCVMPGISCRMRSHARSSSTWLRLRRSVFSESAMRAICSSVSSRTSTGMAPDGQARAW